MRSRRLSSCLRRATGVVVEHSQRATPCFSVRTYFVMQQPALDLDQIAAARMGEAPQSTSRDYPMAGNHQRKIIRAAGLGDGTRRALQQARDIAIGPGFAAGNRRDLVPHTALEGGADLLQRQLETVAWVGGIFIDLYASAFGKRVGGREATRVSGQIHDFRQCVALGAYSDQGERRVEFGLKV